MGVQTEIFEGHAIAGENSGHWRNGLTEGLKTIITFVLAKTNVTIMA